MSRKTVVATLAALSLSLGSAAVAVPATATGGDQHVSRSGRAVLKSSVRSLNHYSDADVLRLLLAAQGPVAEDHPQLKRLLGFDPAKPKTNEHALTTVVNSYLAYNPHFHAQTAIPLRSGDPTRVNEALRVFSVSFNKFIQVQDKKFAPKSSAQASTASARGWFWMGANVVVYANAAAVANAVAYANAGVATFALAGLVVVVWYLEDGSPSGSQFERDHFVKTLTDAFA